MSFESELAYQKQENEEIVASLIEDGSDPEALYVMEHHFSSPNFDTLEQAAVAFFKKGFEVDDAEEMLLDDGAKIFCCDVVIEQALDVERINADCEALMLLAQENKIQYDGWGTYFVDPIEAPDAP
jgi:regulator of RNase E activity RraB